MSKKNDKVTDKNSEISDAIQKCAAYILDYAQNEDGGLKYGGISGNYSSEVWVTAEALFFYLTSKSYHISPDKLKSLVNYILANYCIDSKNGGGYWPMDTESKNCGSNITTGNCLYILKLAILSDLGDINKSKIIEQIEGGEKWLQNQFNNLHDGSGYWGEVKGRFTESERESMRHDHIFCTVNACLGLINPINPTMVLDPEKKTIIKQVKQYIVTQIKFFSDNYKSDNHTNTEELVPSYCWLIIACYYLGITWSEANGVSKLKSEIIKQIRTSPFSVSELLINTHETVSYQTKRNLHNNMPFILTLAIFSMKSNVKDVQKIINKDVQKIINKYVECFKKKKACHLGFGNITSHEDVWPTIEGLIILELYDNLLKKNNSTPVLPIIIILALIIVAIAVLWKLKIFQGIWGVLFSIASASVLPTLFKTLFMGIPNWISIIQRKKEREKE